MCCTCRSDRGFAGDDFSMAAHPNVLVFMTDQMQGQVLEPGHPCRTPNMDRLIERGVRIRKAYPTNSICSPSRASMMTGLLPHNHGVWTVNHSVDEDQCNLRPEHPHWAQKLEKAGYRTGYFGKWHVDKPRDMNRYGWQTFGCERTSMLADAVEKAKAKAEAEGRGFIFKGEPNPIEGWRNVHLWGVLDRTPEERGMGAATGLGIEFLNDAVQGDAPWCCFVSTNEPHDPFVCGKEMFDTYDVDALPLPESVDDPMTDRPGLYRKARRAFEGLSEKDRKTIAACYYASITELDGQLGKLLDVVEKAGQMDNTIVIVTSDHGDFLGAHGMYCKNVTAFEEAYNIPLIMAGPGIAEAGHVDARVGLHDLCPTLPELTGCESIENADSHSFAPLLKDPEAEAGNYQSGYAEYMGCRFIFGQRIIWEGPWKLVFNHFDFDELYNLEEDPHEMVNRVDDPAAADVYRRMMKQMWQRVEETGDHSMKNARYPGLRGVATFGPDIIE